jgi:predicted transcriptional regulator
MQDLRQQVDRLARTTDPAETTALREAIAAALDRSERDLSALLADVKTPGGGTGTR